MSKNELLSDEEKELRVLGIQFGEAQRQLDILEAMVTNLRKEMLRLASVIQNLQQKAEAKRLMQKKTEKKTEVIGEK